VWSWASDGDTFSNGAVAAAGAFTRWAAGEPAAATPGAVDCLSLNVVTAAGLAPVWFSADCDLLRHGVCEGTTREMDAPFSSDLSLGAGLTQEDGESVPSYSIGLLMGLALMCMCLSCVCPRPRALERFGDNTYWTLVRLLPGVKTELAEDQRGNYTKVFLGGMQLPPTHELIAKTEQTYPWQTDKPAKVKTSRFALRSNRGPTATASSSQDPV
jgi:hypothetical protein